MAAQFQLLYDIQTQGLEQLDQVSKKTAQIPIEARYSEASLQKLQSQLDKLVQSGESYRTGLERISSTQRRFGQESAEIARDLLRNDQSLRASRQENIRAAIREAEESERAQKRILNASKSASVLAGVHDSRALDSLLGGALGGPVAIGAVAATATASLGMGMVRDAAKNAEELHRVSEEMGITATQASRLQMAANLSGLKLADMSQAARRLGDALEDPAGSGKKAAEEFTKLGISVQQGLGPAFEEAIQKFGQIKDASERAAAGEALFGRQWRQFLDAGKNLNGVGPGIDENINQKLVEAEAVLGRFDNKWTILKAKLVAGAIIPVVVQVKTAMSASAGYGQLVAGLVESLFNGKPDPVAPNATGQEYTLTPDGKLVKTSETPQRSAPSIDYRRANAALRDNSKADIDEQLAEKKKELDKARFTLDNDVRTAKPGTGVQDRLNTEAVGVEKLRKEYEKLEAVKKAAGRDPSAVPDLIERYRGQVELRQSERDPVAEAQERLKSELREATKSQATPQQLNRIRSIGVGDYFDAMRQRQEQQQELFAKVDQAIQQQSTKDIGKQTEDAFTGTNRAMQAILFGPIQDRLPNGQTVQRPTLSLQSITEQRLQAEQAAKDREFQQLDLQAQTGGIERDITQRSTLRRISGRDTANLDYKDQMEMAQRLYDLRMKEASLEEDADRRALESQRAKYEYISAQDQARIERENKIAEITEQQKQQTRGFATGLFDAALSGQPNATSNFFRSFGRNIAGQIVGNAGEDILGTMNSKLTLQRDSTRPGILGQNAENPNFLGRLLRGTPIGFDPANSKGVPGMEQITSKFTPLVSSTNRNVDALTANTQAVINLTEVVGQGLGINTGALPQPSAPGVTTVPVTQDQSPSFLLSTLTGASRHAEDITKSLQSANPLSVLGSLSKIVGGPGGTSGFAGAVHLPQPTMREDFAAPAQRNALGTEIAEPLTKLTGGLDRLTSATSSTVASSLSSLSRVADTVRTDSALTQPLIDHSYADRHVETLGRLSTGILETAKRLPTNAYTDQSTSIGNTDDSGNSPVALPSTNLIAPPTVSPESMQRSIDAVVRPHFEVLRTAAKSTPPPTLDHTASPALASTVAKAWPTIELGPKPTASAEPTQQRKTAWPTIELPAYTAPNTPQSAGVYAMEPDALELPDFSGMNESLDRFSRSLSLPLPTTTNPATPPATGPSAPPPPIVGTPTRDSLSDLGLFSLPKPEPPRFPDLPQTASAQTDTAEKALQSVQQLGKTFPTLSPAMPSIQVATSVPETVLNALRPSPVESKTASTASSSLDAVRGLENILRPFGQSTSTPTSLQSTPTSLPSTMPQVAGASQPPPAPSIPLTTEHPNLGWPDEPLTGSLDTLSRTLGGFSWPSLNTADLLKTPPFLSTSDDLGPNTLGNTFGAPGAGPLPTPQPYAPSNDASFGMNDVLASMRRGDISTSTTTQQKQQDPELTTATGLASALSQMMGGAKYTESGHGLAGVFTGGMDLGNGQGVALSGTQRLGLGLGMAAQAATGGYEAYQGFSKGGARGDLQGFGGVMAAAAPFAGPAAPFLEAGAAITGLISSLFPDPRQERIKQIQKTLENNAYLTPAARDYNYASGGGTGFSTGDSNSLRSGGQTANYSLNVSAMDANGVLNHFKQSPELWSQAMLIGMTSGDASAVQSLVSWNSAQGSSIPNVWSNSGGR